MVRRALTNITKHGYRRAAKPLLFRRTPDEVHHRMIKVASTLQQVPVIRSLPQAWAYRNDHRLAQRLFGIDFFNPIGLSAGLDKNIEIAGMIKSIGFGFMTGGSVTYRKCDGNPKPWFRRLPHSRALLVYAGLPNDGVRTICARLTRYSEATFVRFPLVVSVAYTNTKKTATLREAIDDYLGSLRQLELSKSPQLYEINISCPNTYGGEPFTTPERLERLLSAIDELGLKRPVTLKMPIDLSWSEFSTLLDVTMQHNVAGVTIGNLLKNRSTVNMLDELDPKTPGNLGGALNRDISTELIRRTYQHVGGKLIIIGVGGVFLADDAYAKIRAGASLVELITGLIYEGPQLIGDINRGLVRLLKQDGFTNISEAIGIDAKRV